MSKEEHQTISFQVSILKDIAKTYGGKTIDNVIMQLEARLKEANK